MDIDPLDAARDYAVDQAISAAQDRAHRDEAVWLLTHITMHPRYEDNRSWFLRWKKWVERERSMKWSE